MQLSPFKTWRFEKADSVAGQQRVVSVVAAGSLAHILSGQQLCSFPLGLFYLFEA